MRDRSARPVSRGALGLCRAAELRVLLDALGDAARVAEIGTAAAWTTSCLALARPGREIHSWDVKLHPARERLLFGTRMAIYSRTDFVERRPFDHHASLPA